MLYLVAVVVHVLVAVLAVGLVGAIPLTARLARRSDGALAGAEKLLGSLLRAVQVGLLVMLLTGGLIDLSAAGAFHKTGWFRASVVLLVVLGAALGRVRAALRRGFTPGGVRENALARVEQWGWAMCALVAMIVVLMQMKPFP
jgi:hypothetical protein